MLVCGQCHRRGLNTVIAIRGVWRYSIKSTKDMQLIVTLEEEFRLPDDLGESTGMISLKCARCGNDFFIPCEWIKKGKKDMKGVVQITKGTVHPVCTDCPNEESFLFYSLGPVSVVQLGENLSISKVINDKRENVTDKKSAEAVYNTLVNGDLTVQILCRECNSNNVDLVPIVDEDNIANTHLFDSEYMGKQNEL